MTPVGRTLPKKEAKIEQTLHKTKLYQEVILASKCHI